MSESRFRSGTSGVDTIDDPLVMTDLLRHPDPFVRVDALSRAAREEPLVEPICTTLLDDYPLVRREAVRALGRIGGAEASRALLDASAHDLSAEVREEAVAALGAILRIGRGARSAQA